MLLYLMRHGLAAEASDAGTRDGERPLTDRGRRRVEQVAEALADVGAAPDLILASPLVRAQQTAQLVARAFPRAKVKTTASLAPGSDPAALVEEAATARGAREVLCVGHAPQLDLVIARACAGVEFPICELKKAGVACLDLEGYSRRAVIRWVLPPGLVRRLR